MSEEVRLATLEDLNDLVVLGEASFNFGGLNDYYDYDTDKALVEFTAMIEDDDKLMMVLDTNEGVKGMFAAVAFNALCGTNAVSTYEQYIWIDEDHRSGYTMRRFMRGYGSWGEALGAVNQYMVSHNEHDKLPGLSAPF